MFAQRGYPKVLRSDHGPEFVGVVLLDLAVERGLRNLHIEPDKPWQNGTNGSSSVKFRDECLAMN